METTVVQSLAIAFGGALAGVVGTLVAAWVNRRKTSAETGQAVAQGADEVVGSAITLMKEMRFDVTALKQRVIELEQENKLLKDTVEKQGKVIEGQGLIIARLESELSVYMERELDEV